MRCVDSARIQHKFNMWKWRKKEKPLKPCGFNGFRGGDKRDRTADLLNAIDRAFSGGRDYC